MASRVVVAVDTVQEIRDLTHTLRRNLGVLVPAEKKVYVYFPSSMAADDGENWLKPTVTDCPCCGGRGRWKGYDFCCSDGGGGGSVVDATAIAKGILKLTYDLGGTADLPEVVAIHEASGPDQLTFGPILDGEGLKRVGNTIVSAPLTSGGDFMADGSVPMTGDLDHGGNKATNMDDGVAADDGATVGQVAAEASVRATADGLLVPKARVVTTTAPLKINGGASADLSADPTLSIIDATTGAKGVVQLATPSADVTAGHVIQANDSRLSDSRSPTAHATSHKNGGGDEVATATPGANEIPKASAAGKLAAGWGGAASSLATLNSGTKVVEDPANATATPTASKIPIASAGGKLDSWISDSAAGVKGLIELDTDLGGTASAPKVVAITESGGTQLVLGAIADGQATKRVGGTLVGYTPGGSSYTDEELLWDKKYFEDGGWLPTNKIKDFSYDWDAPTVASGSVVRDKGAMQVTSGGVVYYDLGAGKTKILTIVCCTVPNIDFGHGVDDTVPTGSHGIASFDEGTALWKNFSTPLGTTRTRATALTAGTGWALYWTPTVQVVFERHAGGRWFIIVEATDTSFSTMRYWFLYALGGQKRFITPALAWAD